jgi:hypothetical protein
VHKNNAKQDTKTTRNDHHAEQGKRGYTVTGWDETAPQRYESLRHNRSQYATRPLKPRTFFTTPQTVSACCKPVKPCRKLTGWQILNKLTLRA